MGGSKGAWITGGSTFAATIEPMNFKDVNIAIQINGTASALFESPLRMLSGVTTGIEITDSAKAIALSNINFTGTKNPVILRDGSQLITRSTVTGTGDGTNPLFRINDGSRLTFSVLPTTTGGSSDFSFDGMTKSYADLPFVSASLSTASVRSP